MTTAPVIKSKRRNRVRYIVGNEKTHSAKPSARIRPNALTEKPPRAVIYTRVSTEEQVREGMSLEAQQIACLAYCDSSGYEVAKVFVEEGESAKSADRTQLKELIKFCREQGDVGFVVVHKLDRFARSTQDHMQLRGVLAAMGVTLRSATEPIDDTSPGRFMETIFAAVAQFDNEIRADRSTGGMRQKLENGFWTFPPPLGYEAGRDGQGNKCLMPDPSRAGLITWAFERFSTGLHTKQEVLREVTMRGLTTRKGKAVSGQTFEQTLRKPVYAGRVVVPEWKINVRGRHQPLVTEEVFQKVQEIIDGRRPTVTPRPRNNDDFPLRHFVRCGQCGEPLTGSWSRSKTKRPYAYYHCQDGCTRVPKATFETQFVELLKRLQPNPEYMQLFREVMRDVWKARQADVLAKRSALQRRLRELKGKQERLEEAFIFERSIDSETYNRNRTAVLSEIALVDIEIRDVSTDDVEIEGALNFAEEVMVNASNLWKSASLAQKQRFQQVLFPEALEYENCAYRTSATCFLFNGLGAEQASEGGLLALSGIEPEFED